MSYISETWSVPKPKKPLAEVPDWARRLAAARTMVELNQTRFAKECGISQQRYSLYENGSREPPIAVWLAILPKLGAGVTLDFIITGRREHQANHDAQPERAKKGR